MTTYSRFSMSVDYRDLKELTELLEDCISHYCDTNQQSGQKAWALAELLAKAKVREYHDIY